MSIFIEKSQLLVKYFKNRIQHRPISVNLEVTKRCNATCDFCDYWKTKKENVIDDYGPIVKAIDPMMITITGGEPMLRPNLAEIIRNIKKAVPVSYIAMITNGSLMTYDKAKELYQAGLRQMSFSLDFVDERHDTSRGIPGLWKHMEALIPTLKDIGFDAVNLNWIIREENYDQTKLAAETAKKWNATISYTSYSDLKNMNDRHFLSEDNLKNFPNLISELLNIKKTYKRIRNSDYYLEMMPKFYNHEQIGGCPAGLRWIQITPEGWFKPCSELPPVVFWDKYDHKSSFKKQDCTLCWYGCRGEAQAPIDFKRFRELANV